MRIAGSKGLSLLEKLSKVNESESEDPFKKNEKSDISKKSVCLLAFILLNCSFHFGDCPGF